jgi:alanine racemase
MRLETSFEVRLDLLAKNFEHLKGLTPDNEIIFMVKADAYGHGLLPIVEFATVELGIKNFGCASVGEAIAIRRNLPHLECNLWVFSDLNLELKAAKEAYLNLNILPVIAHKVQLEMFLEDKDFDSSPLVLKLDTGMNRLGVHEQELNEIISLLKKHNRRQIFHLMTHFGNSYLKLRDGDKTHKQYQLFLKLKQQLQTAGISIEQTRGP